jgi:glycosyltransferase involved in cell wall biosynthesis
MVTANGVDTKKFQPDPVARAEVRADLDLDESDFLVGTSARVDPMKDYPMFMEALGEVKGAHGLAVGRGTDGLPDQPSFVGLGERADIPRVLNALDLYVSASAFGEGFSNALVEAMATGLPVITTDVGDAALIVDECGVVVKPHEPRILAGAIIELKDDPARREHLGRTARTRVAAKYDLAEIVLDFEALHADWRL